MWAQKYLPEAPARGEQAGFARNVIRSSMFAPPRWRFGLVEDSLRQTTIRRTTSLRTTRIYALMLLAALASAAAAQDAPTNAGDSTALARDNVVILLDASGSMEDTMSGSDASRMDVAKQALAKVVDQIDARTNVGFLV